MIEVSNTRDSEDVQRINEDYRKSIGLVGMSVIEYMEKVEEGIREVNERIEDDNVDRSRRRRGRSLGYMDESLWPDRMSDSSDNDSAANLSSLVDTMRASVFKVRVTNAFNDLIMPLATSMEIMEIESRELQMDLNNIIIRRLEGVIFAVNDLKETESSFFMRAGAFYNRLLTHPGLMILSGLGKVLKSTLGLVTTGISKVLFGFGKKKTDTDRIVDAIKEQTQFLRTGNILPDSNFFEDVFNKGLLGTTGGMAGRGVLSAFGLSKKNAEQTEEKLRDGEQLDFFDKTYGMFSRFLRGGEIAKEAHKKSGLYREPETTKLKKDEKDKTEELFEEQNEILFSIFDFLKTHLNKEYAFSLNEAAKERQYRSKAMAAVDNQISSAKDQSEHTNILLTKVRNATTEALPLHRDLIDIQEEVEDNTHDTAKGIGKLRFMMLLRTMISTVQRSMHMLISALAPLGVGAAGLLLKGFWSKGRKLFSKEGRRFWGRGNRMFDTQKKSFWNRGKSAFNSFWSKGKSFFTKHGGSFLNSLKTQFKSIGNMLKSPGVSKTIQTTAKTISKVRLPIMAPITAAGAWLSSGNEEGLTDEQSKNKKIGNTVGATGGLIGGAAAGGLAGAKTGALIGSIFGPAGTTIGGAIGGLGGSLYGGYKGSELGQTIGDKGADEYNKRFTEDKIKTEKSLIEKIGDLITTMRTKMFGASQKEITNKLDEIFGRVDVNKGQFSPLRSNVIDVKRNKMDNLFDPVNPRKGQFSPMRSNVIDVKGNKLEELFGSIGVGMSSFTTNNTTIAPNNEGTGKSPAPLALTGVNEEMRSLEGSVRQLNEETKQNNEKANKFNMELIDLNNMIMKNTKGIYDESKKKKDGNTNIPYDSGTKKDVVNGITGR